MIRRFCRIVHTQWSHATTITGTGIFLGTVVVKLSSTPAPCDDRGVRRTISALITVAAAAVLAVVTVFVPNLPLWVSPAVLSVLVIGFSIAWPVTVSPTP